MIYFALNFAGRLAVAVAAVSGFMKAGINTFALCLGWLQLLAGVGTCAEKIKLLSSGKPTGHYLAWRGRPIMLVGDSVTQEVDIVTRHPQPWVGHYQEFARGFLAAPPKPYLCSEPVPEFDGAKPSLDEVRRSIWEITLAGAGWVNQNDPSFGWDPRAAIGSQAAARDQAYDYAGHCACFFNQSGVEFWTMSPQPKLSSTGICLAQPGEAYVVYVADGGSFTTDLSAAAGTKLAVRWFNPRTGLFAAVAAVDGGNLKQPFTPPFTGDAVLYLKRQAK